MAHVLIVDDDESFANMLSRSIARLGHQVEWVKSREEGLAVAAGWPCDIVYLDVNLPDGNGLGILAEVRNTPSHPEVIIITGSGRADGAELAIECGAWDFIGKGSSRQEIMLPLVRALQYRDERSAAKTKIFDRGGIVGESPALLRCLGSVAQAANSDADVLITGETGTGKELIAIAIHENSARKQGNFVVVDCGALPEQLVESILFGHVKGAFTGADRDRDGLVLQAHNGTLFLDEVGELPIHLQKAFLRVLQGRTFRPIGGQRELTSNFRLVAATNRNLSRMVTEGTLREDLLFRLRVLTVEVPALRERNGDVRAIAIHYTNTVCARHGRVTKGFSPEFLATLDAHAWPGNVRELLHTMDRVFAAAGDDPVLFPKHLPTELRVKMIREAVGSEDPEENDTAETDFQYDAPETFPRMKDVREAALAKAEKQYLQHLMKAVRGDIPEACRIADLSASRLYELLKIYDVPRK